MIAETEGFQKYWGKKRKVKEAFVEKITNL